MKVKQVQLDKLLGVFVKYISRETVKAHCDEAKVKSPFYILSRELYREQVLSLPLMDRKALKQAIDFEIQGQDDDAVYIVNQAVNNGINVNIYWLDPSLKTLAGGLIPESLIVGNSLDEGAFVQYDNGTAQVYLAKNSKGVCSKVSSGLFANPEYFCASHGVAITDVTVLAKADFFELLHNNWFRLPWPKCTGLWHKAASSSESIIDRLSKAVVPFSVLFSLYLLLSSAFTSFQVGSASDDLTQLRSEVGSALQVRNEVRDLDKYLTELVNIESATQSKWRLWPAIVPLYEMGSQIERITVTDDVVDIRVRTDSSSGVLQSLISNPNVESAKFSGPVRKVRNQEMVNVEVKLTPKVAK